MATKRATTARGIYGKAEDRYLELVRRFPLRPLQDDADLDAAIAVVDSLLDRPRLAVAEQDYLDVLSDVIEDYETKTIEMPPLDDADLLEFLIEQKGVTQAATAVGTRIAESTISEVLAGKRRLNRTQISKLSRFFQVSPEVFHSSD